MKRIRVDQYAGDFPPALAIGEETSSGYTLWRGVDVVRSARTGATFRVTYDLDHAFDTDAPKLEAFLAAIHFIHPEF